MTLARMRTSIPAHPSTASDDFRRKCHLRYMTATTTSPRRTGVDSKSGDDQWSHQQCHLLHVTTTTTINSSSAFLSFTATDVTAQNDTSVLMRYVAIRRIRYLQCLDLQVAHGTQYNLALDAYVTQHAYRQPVVERNQRPHCLALTPSNSSSKQCRWCNADVWQHSSRVTQHVPRHIDRPVTGAIHARSFHERHNGLQRRSHSRVINGSEHLLSKYIQVSL